MLLVITRYEEKEHEAQDEKRQLSYTLLRCVEMVKKLYKRDTTNVGFCYTLCL
jgi:hypothetical protein